MARARNLFGPLPQWAGPELAQGWVHGQGPRVQVSPLSSSGSQAQVGPASKLAGPICPRAAVGPTVQTSSRPEWAQVSNRAGPKWAHLGRGPARAFMGPDRKWAR